MKFVTTFLAVFASVSIVGCSSSPKNIDSIYVSSAVYNSYDCEQIDIEYARVRRKVAEVIGHQGGEAGKDAVAMGVGLVLFWPALFFLAGGNDQKEQLGRLKGELEALESAAVEKKCAGFFTRLETERRNAEAKRAAEAEKLKKQKLEGCTPSATGSYPSWCAEAKE